MRIVKPTKEETTEDAIATAAFFATLIEKGTPISVAMSMSQYYVQTLILVRYGGDDLPENEPWKKK
jgi:hypothetical protein